MKSVNEDIQTRLSSLQTFIMKANLDIVSLAENSHNNFVFYISPNHDAAFAMKMFSFLIYLYRINYS